MEERRFTSAALDDLEAVGIVSVTTELQANGSHLAIGHRAGDEVICGRASSAELAMIDALIRARDLRRSLTEGSG